MRRCLTKNKKLNKKIKINKKKSFSYEVSEVEIEEMFDVADTDRDGIIGYPEFMVRDFKMQIKIQKIQMKIQLHIRNNAE